MPLPFEHMTCQPALARFLEHVNRPFARDQRLVVRAADRHRALFDRERDDLLRADRRDGMPIDGSRNACVVTQFWQ